MKKKKIEKLKIMENPYSLGEPVDLHILKLVYNNLAEKINEIIEKSNLK